MLGLVIIFCLLLFWGKVVYCSPNFLTWFSGSLTIREFAILPDLLSPIWVTRVTSLRKIFQESILKVNVFKIFNIWETILFGPTCKRLLVSFYGQFSAIPWFKMMLWTAWFFFFVFTFWIISFFCLDAYRIFSSSLEPRTFPMINVLGGSVFFSICWVAFICIEVFLYFRNTFNWNLFR